VCCLQTDLLTSGENLGPAQLVRFAGSVPPARRVSGGEAERLELFVGLTDDPVFAEALSFGEQFIECGAVVGLESVEQ